MRSLINNVYFKCKYGAQVHSSLVGRTVELGRDTFIKDGAVIRDSTLGSCCFVNRAAEIYSSDIMSYCSIGQMVQIGPNEHLIDEISTSNSLGSDIYLSKLETMNNRRTTLGADVWVGSRSILLKGIKVGTGAIIAAGAVVTSDVPNYAIVAGVPARIIRFRFADHLIARLLDSSWWNVDYQKLKHSQALSAREITPEKKVEVFLDSLSGEV